MRKRWWMFVVGPPAFLLFIALGGEIVKLLWNALMPEIFGWRALTFWQALGLLALTRILFGGLGGRGGPRTVMRRRMKRRWEEMTPEQREQFRQELRSRCGSRRSESDGRVSGAPAITPE